MSEHRLSPTLRRHLVELLGKDGASLYWAPNGAGEWRSAQALARRGLVRAHYVGVTQFELTDAGLALARALKAAR